MSTKAELIKDSMLRIQILELKLKLDPENKSLLELLEEEKKLLHKIETSN